jgi:hypothetical protein
MYLNLTTVGSPIKESIISVYIDKKHDIEKLESRGMFFNR